MLAWRAHLLFLEPPPQELRDAMIAAVSRYHVECERHSRHGADGDQRAAQASPDGGAESIPNEQSDANTQQYSCRGDETELGNRDSNLTHD